MKTVLILLLALLSLPAENDIRVLQFTGVELNEGDKKTLIERKIPSACLGLGINVETIFGGHEANNNVPQQCKKSFVTTVGKIQPMQLEFGVQTVGELEVLDFINKMQKDPDSYILVDSRKIYWYEHATIPGAINIPYDEIAYDPDFPEDHARMLNLLHIQKSKEGYDFSKVKKALLFCNGSWCVQSSKAVKTLISMGYPAKKLLWYRGGLQNWLSLNLTLTQPTVK